LTEWHLTDVQSNYGAWYAIGLDALSPWESEWNNNGLPYGIPVVTEGDAGCAADPICSLGRIAELAQVEIAGICVKPCIKLQKVQCI